MCCVSFVKDIARAYLKQLLLSKNARKVICFKARLHWRFLLRFQAQFRKLLAIEIAAETPVVYTGDLKSPRNRSKNR